MAFLRVKERVTRKPALAMPPVGFSVVTKKPKISPRLVQVEKKLQAQADDRRWQHELKEMQETDDLKQIDDDVEAATTLFEWQALEHTHRPKSALWFVALAAGTTAIAALLVFLGNIIGAITIALGGAVLYSIAQRHPHTMRYRLLVDGVALNDILYHYRDLQRFNIVYQPGHTKTVLLHSKHHLTPLLHMEIGDADPVAIRDILLEFVPEDIHLDEPLVDVLARRVGF